MPCLSLNVNELSIFRFNTKLFHSYCQFHLKLEENLNLHTCVYLLPVHMTKNTYMYKIHICICKYTPGLSRCIFTRGCIFAHVQINFYIYAIAFTCPKIHPGANYTYMYNIHPVCKSAHVNGALAKQSSSKS